MRILVVDDSTVMRKMVIRTLKKAGYGDHDISEAKDGEDALEKTLSEPPNLVLCDWNMPKMDGVDYLRALNEKNFVVDNDIRFGFVTTEGSEQRRKEASDAGALFLLTKPFTADDMREIIEGAINGPGPGQLQNAQTTGPTMDELEAAAAQAAAESRYELTNEGDVEGVLMGLTSLGIKVQAGAALRLSTQKMTAVYSLEGNPSKGFCFCDLDLCGYLGGVFAGMDRAAIDDALADGILDAELQDAMTELFNVASNFFRPVQGVHLKLEKVLSPEQRLDKDQRKSLFRLEDRLDLEVEVPDFGSGVLSLALGGRK